MRKPGRSVLDSFALIAFLFREGTSEKVAELFEWAASQGERHLISAVNWAEVRYVIERRTTPSKWLDLRERLAGLPLEIVPADKALAEQAAEFKAKGGMSLADCVEVVWL